MKKIKIYSDKRYLPKDGFCVGLLIPFWFPGSTESTYSWEHVFEHYNDLAHVFFEMTSLEEADIAVLPFSFEAAIGRSLRDKVNIEYLKLACEFCQRVEDAGKKVLVNFVGPRSHESVPFTNALVMRGALYQSQKKSSDIPLPRWTEDIIKYYCNEQLIVRKKSRKPIVGFCGYLHHDWIKSHIKDFLYKSNHYFKHRKLQQSPFLGHLIRSQTVKLCEKSSEIETNFIIRDKYSFLSEKSPELKRKVRAEYIDNMISSDYILCCRGSANTSIRFYETLCAGRIPVFVNTDCALPFETEIDWKKYCVWVEERELDLLPEKIADFHLSLTDDEFIELQYKCRQIWKSYLSPEGFYGNLHKIICNFSA